jgi:hypothetical protein
MPDNVAGGNEVSRMVVETDRRDRGRNVPNLQFEKPEAGRTCIRIGIPAYAL